MAAPKVYPYFYDKNGLLAIIEERLEKFVYTDLKVEVLLRALEQLHSEGMFHRDIAPDNIMQLEEAPVLIDFGQAKKTDAVGTPFYSDKAFIDQKRDLVALARSLIKEKYQTQLTAEIDKLVPALQAEKAFARIAINLDMDDLSNIETDNEGFPLFWVLLRKKMELDAVLKLLADKGWDKAALTKDLGGRKFAEQWKEIDKVRGEQLLDETALLENFKQALGNLDRVGAFLVAAAGGDYDDASSALRTFKAI